MSNEDVKIARLEEKYNNLDKEVAEVKDVVVKIKDNHLVHLAQQITDTEINLGNRIGSLETKLAFYIGGGTILIGAIELAIKLIK